MNEIITKESVKKLLPKREQDSHKGSFGSVLNIAGSKNYRGAAYLSTISPLRVGAGYVALASIGKAIDTVSKLCPETIFIELEEKNGCIKSDEYSKIVKLIPKYKVLSVGCGLSIFDGSGSEAETFVMNLLSTIQKIENPVVIDADGINIISKLRIEKLPKNTILTPHPRELSKLLGAGVSEIQKNREYYSLEAAKKYNSVIVLKGHNTVITDGQKVFINETGNSALAKAGTGDVLTGIISGFCAQGVKPLDSAILGVYLHGLCGEIASRELSEYSVLASDLIKYLPFAIKTLID